MTGLLLGAGWALVVAVVVDAQSPPPRRLEPDDTMSLPSGHGAPRRPAVLTSPVTALGAGVRGVARRPADPTADRRTGGAVLLGLVLVPLAPILALLPALAAVVGPRLAAQRTVRRREAAVIDEVPDVVDLLTITATAGLPVSASLHALGPRVGGVLGPPLNRAATMLTRGVGVTDALETLGATGGAPLHPLIDALAEHDRYGSPLRPSLERVGIEARLRRRRAAEEAARRLPVTLLFPLVFTTLPAFVLLTVVPLLAGSLGSLSL